GRTDERRVVLLVPEQNVDQPRRLGHPTANRLQTSGARLSGQVAREAVKNGVNHLQRSPRRDRYHAMTTSPLRRVKSAAGARKTPNGTSGSAIAPPVRRRRSQTIGATMTTKTTAPTPAATKIVSNARWGPNAAPTTAINVTSPKPMASLPNATSPSQPMIEMAPAPTQAPISESYGTANMLGSPVIAPASDVVKSQIRPKTVNPSGIK